MRRKVALAGVILAAIALAVALSSLAIMANTGFWSRDDGDAVTASESPESKGQTVGFSGLPVVQLSYVCDDEYELCFFRSSDFNENFEFVPTSATQFGGGIPLVPQAEYATECVERDATDDWERFTLGASVRDCRFLLTLAAYLLDGNEGRLTGLQNDPAPLPSGPPPGMFPPSPDSARTPLPTPYSRSEKNCAARPPVTDDEGFWLGRIVHNCREIESRVVGTPAP